MQSQWIWTVRRSRPAYARAEVAHDIARMCFQHGAVRAMQPGDDQDVIAGGNSVQCTSKFGMHLEPRVWRALGTLPRRLGKVAQIRANVSDCLKRKFLAHLRYAPIV